MATDVDVRIVSGDAYQENSYIEIIDDGHGMDEVTIREAWFMIGTPFRQKRSIEKGIGEQVRAVTGEKGLGRLSSARLGSFIQVITRKRRRQPLEFSLDWDDLLMESSLEQFPINISHLPHREFSEPHGTRIKIAGLRINWSDEKIEDLRRNLARLLSPFSAAENFSLNLHVKSDGEDLDIQSITPTRFMSKPKYLIKGKFDTKGVISAQYIYRPIDGSKGRDTRLKENWTSLYDSLSHADQSGLNRSNPGCGPFRFEIRAWDLTKDDTRDIADHFQESRSHVRGVIAAQRGVSVYRDDILVLPKSEGSRDWLGLDLRRISRVGPRLSTSQVVGYVQITRSDNPEITDTSDREGLVSNTATIAFRHLITRIIDLLEVERGQDRLTKKDSGSATELFADLNADSLVEELETLREHGADMADAVDVAKSFGRKIELSRAAIEKRFGYYNRLAVIGTIAQMVIHEIRNRTTVIGRGLRLTKDALSGIRVKRAKPALKKAKESVTALEGLADRFAPLASRGYRPGRRTSIVEDSVDRCLSVLDPDIRSSEVTVETSWEARTAVRIDPGEFSAVLLNLITNSLYWMQRKKDGERHLRISLMPSEQPGRITVSVDDSGPGVDPEDKDRIFWPGVTRKPDGIGMGLTVASELIDAHGGRMQTVVPGELGGATFQFDLPLVDSDSTRGTSDG